MKFRFMYETFMGIILFLAVLFFGQKGLAALSLLAPLPVLMRLMHVKPDEREIFLFYRSGNASLGLTILILVGLYFTSSWSFNNHTLGEYWMPLSIAGILFSRGIAGWVYLSFF